MRQITYIIFLILIISSCSESRRVTEADAYRPAGDSKRINQPDMTMDLADHLRKLPGITVTGSGEKARITIRGASSLNLTNEPLYILDGIQINGFENLYSMVRVQEIDHIEVLKDVADLGVYGSLGANGVIRITTKSH